MNNSNEMDRLEEKLLLVNRNLAHLWNMNDRCRYDEIILKQAPLSPGEKMHPKEECNGCPYPGRMEDPFCKKYMQHWLIVDRMNAIIRDSEKLDRVVV